MSDTYDLAGMADPNMLSRHARRSFPTRLHPAREHIEPETTIREAHYRGHVIRVATSYRITIDDVPVTGHVAVGHDGQVHYHSIPNQQFESAVDMVKRIIDLTPPGRIEDNSGHPDVPLSGGHGENLEGGHHSEG